MMMLRILCLFSALALTANEKAQLFNYEYIRELVTHGRGRIEISQGSQNCLEISASTSPFISLDQGVLTIKSAESIKAKLTVKDLQKISLSGTVQVDIDELQGNRFMIVMEPGGTSLLEGTLYFNRLVTTLYGDAQVSLRGKVNNQTIFIRGSGTFAGERLKTEKTHINVRGATTACVWATDQLHTSGTGSVQYVGNPRTNGTKNDFPYRGDAHEQL